jgi:hypothetical protein
MGCLGGKVGKWGTGNGGETIAFLLYFCQIMYHYDIRFHYEVITIDKLVAFLVLFWHVAF